MHSLVQKSLVGTIELWRFGVKQAYACLFGAFLLLIMIVTSFWYPLESVHRYDFIFIAAVVFQLVMLVFKLETLKETWVIFSFHIVATVMELFKTSPNIGSWYYPEAYYLGIANVPLFTGFMYSAVGSYIARVWRLFDFRFEGYPPKAWTVILVCLIYANFFTHHFMVDLRWWLLLGALLLFGRTTIYFKVTTHYRTMPLLVGWALVALFIWFAENIATYTHIWVYPNQGEKWQVVPMTKWIAWFLLMQLSFVLVSLLNTVDEPLPTKKP